MKRLVVCSDGTWNNPEQEDNGIPAPTNVFKIYNAIAADDDGTVQLRYYHPGVGGEGGIFDKIAGGALGVGISRHIKSAFHWLGTNYDVGDDIYLYGFSRGAFTARSIGGFLSRGLLDLRGLGPKDAWQRVDAAFDAYRHPGNDRSWAENDWAFFHGADATPVKFVGVWDTVGALGIPDDLEILNFFEKPDNWRFHDTNLGANVSTARHAMAVDEVRSSFTITRWANAQAHPDAKELWFPGVHSDVGGGYAETGLSDVALQWMMEESASTGLCFRPGVEAGIHPNPIAAMHNSYKGAFAKLRSRPRNVNAMVTSEGGSFHASTLARQQASPIAYPPYHPTTILEVGERHEVDGFADTHWNATGLYLEAGHEYTFSAAGEWQDSKDNCDWRGTEDGKLTAGDMVRAASSFLGNFEKLFEKMSKNESTDFLGTKRCEDLNWFTLVGAIANDSGRASAVGNDGSPTPHQFVALVEHETTPLRIESPGYLYCFPNDVWSLYGNNHGSVRLTVTREA
ncbi:MAG: DUF2235 domain-containing protein [Rhodospirillaceae bacterium]|nr:DUF2235 domain-containing protein [Rhodospirillaceae bacterium]